MFEGICFMRAGGGGGGRAGGGRAAGGRRAVRPPKFSVTVVHIHRHYTCLSGLRWH